MKNFFSIKNKLIIPSFAFLSILLLSSFAFAGQIKIAWDPVTDSNLSGYKVYYGVASDSYGTPIDVGNTSAYALTGLISGQTYFISVTAYDTSKVESVFSNEVSGTAVDAGSEAINSPGVLSGPTSGITGTSYSYTTGGAASTLGHSVQYQFDWKGDGSDLSSWGSTSQSKSWTSTGTYSVRARARCTTDTSIISSWSSVLAVTITTTATETVSTPSVPSGTASGTTGTSYSYTTGGATSNLGHSVQYQFDWKGDGSDLSSWGSTSQSKSWTSTGTYSVRARARCTTDTSIISSWSSVLAVTITTTATETVSTPSVPSGTASGTTGTSYSYTTGGAASTLSHSVQYQFDWKGDGSDLSSWGSTSQSKSWTSTGTYSVRARARCTTDTSIISSWSSSLSVTIVVSGGAVTGPPGGATLVSPTGASVTTAPTYTWNAVAGATQYYLWVANPIGNPKIMTWYTSAQAGCASGTGTCSITPATALTAGAATWWIQTSNTYGLGPWSAQMDFTVAASGGTSGSSGSGSGSGTITTAPGIATLVSPTGASVTTAPTYTWNAVAGATQYYLWVANPIGNPKIMTWYTSAQAGCASGTGTCSITPATALTAGAATWWIQTSNTYGLGPWSAQMDFTVAASGGTSGSSGSGSGSGTITTAPGIATLVSPTGATVTTAPTYTWNAVTGATQYYLWVANPIGNPKIMTWYTSAQAGCASGTGTCSITPATALTAGAATWWIQTSNTYGLGPWSAQKDFTVP